MQYFNHDNSTLRNITRGPAGPVFALGSLALRQLVPNLDETTEDDHLQVSGPPFCTQLCHSHFAGAQVITA